MHWNANGRRAIAVAVSEIDRGFEAGDQSLVAIGGRSNNRRQCPRMLQQSTDVPQRHLAQAGIEIPDQAEDEVEKFKEFLDQIKPEDFAG